MEQEDLVRRYYQQGLGYRKISRLTGISENTIKSFLRRNSAAGKHTCLQCGKALEIKAHTKEKRFCSYDCRMKWWKAHPERINKKAIYQKVCPKCGKAFECYGAAKRIYCSVACYADARRKEI
jgi:transposase